MTFNNLKNAKVVSFRCKCVNKLIMKERNYGSDRQSQRVQTHRMHYYDDISPILFPFHLVQPHILIWEFHDIVVII